MRLIIKGRKQFKVPADLADFVEDKVRRFENRIPENSIVELEFADTRGPKGGKDKVCDLTMVLPGEKNAIHFTERTENFRKSVEFIEEKLERALKRYKEKRSFQDRGHG